MLYAVRVRKPRTVVAFPPIGLSALSLSLFSSSWFLRETERREIHKLREGGCALVSCCCGADGSAGFWFFSGPWPWNTGERERERSREYKSRPCGSKRAGPRNGNDSLQGSLSLSLLLVLKSNLRRLKGKSRKNAVLSSLSSASSSVYSLSLSTIFSCEGRFLYHRTYSWRKWPEKELGKEGKVVEEEESPSTRKKKYEIEERKKSLKKTAHTHNQSGTRWMLENGAIR